MNQPPSNVSPELNLELAPRRAVAECDSLALVSNLKSLLGRCKGQLAIPMVKANGYGHGAQWVAKTLSKSCPELLFGFGVATLDEGIEVRRALSSSLRVLVFSGTLPWQDDTGSLCERFGLTPVISSLSDWKAFLAGGWTTRLPYHLKFNTGMNRLGIQMESLEEVAQSLIGLVSKGEKTPEGICSHLAAAESPSLPLSLRQLDRFKEIRARLGGICPKTSFHLGNSGAILNAEAWQLKDMGQLVRPGIALYSLTPVLTLKAQVLQLRELAKGDAIGYGFTPVIEEGPHAILGLGYGDGLHRTLSFKAPFAGIVSMDLSAVRLPPSMKHIKPGDWLTVFGKGHEGLSTLENLAQNSGTISYEVLTSLSPRVKRVYG